MTELRQLRHGLTIFAIYGDSETPINHDDYGIYAGSTPPAKMSPQDRKHLEELGWEWNRKFESWYLLT